MGKLIILTLFSLLIVLVASQFNEESSGPGGAGRSRGSGGGLMRKRSRGGALEERRKRVIEMVIVIETTNLVVDEVEVPEVKKEDVSALSVVNQEEVVDGRLKKRTDVNAMPRKVMNNNSKVNLTEELAVTGNSRLVGNKFKTEDNHKESSTRTDGDGLMNEE
ncbi:hypothetical protein GPALN_005058 [Globodera pallida]|nr:hypothetical protein GPALN_005058 [Globodera pallida]